MPVFSRCRKNKLINWAFFLKQITLFQRDLLTRLGHHPEPLPFILLHVMRDQVSITKFGAHKHRDIAIGFSTMKKSHSLTIYSLNRTVLKLAHVCLDKSLHVFISHSNSIVLEANMYAYNKSYLL